MRTVALTVVTLTSACTTEIHEGPRLRTVLMERLLTYCSTLAWSALSARSALAYCDGSDFWYLWASGAHAVGTTPESVLGHCRCQSI